MWKAQNQELNLKLFKLVEDKDSQTTKLSKKIDFNFSQLMNDIYEKFVKKRIEEEGYSSQQGGDKKKKKQSKPEQNEPEKYIA